MRVSKKTSNNVAGRLLLMLLISVVPAIAARASGGEEPPAPEAKTAQPENYFDIHEYRVLGNTVLSNREIETVLYPLLGDHKTLKDVEAARVALEKEYHDRGFGTVFVDIPEQDVSDKIVRLKATEGRLHEVRIHGARYFSERKILAAVPEASAGTVPNLPSLQEQLTGVNVQSADRSVVPILKAGPLPGTVDLELKVDDHLPVHGSLEMDNQNTPDTKQLRATASLSYANLFQDFDNLSLQYQTSPQNASQVRVLAANNAWGSFGSALRPSVYFVDSDSNVPTVGTLGVIGKGQIYGARLGYFVSPSTTEPQSITIGIDYKHFLQTVALAATPGISTPISYTNLSLGYAGTWTSDLVTGTFDTTANFGPRGLPNNPGTFANKCFGCEPNYFYLKSDGSLDFHLPLGFQVIGRAQGQFATEPLITNEEFSITGAYAVRGYLEAEVLSDKGYVGNVQLQSPIAHLHSLALGDIFVFYDAGRGATIDALPGQPLTTFLSSRGVGLQLLPSYWINGLLTWADPLRNGPYTRRGDSRILFMIRGSF
jgi:hemolysin activation/secretion protein